ncbi:MAG TPA: hypothetical protein VIP70_13270 [Nitrososphaeraceae archaeon]
MPAKSKPLGFACPSCKLEYGSISIEKQKNWEKKEKKRAQGRTHDSYSNRPRTSLKPSEYAFDNTLLEWFQKEITIEESKQLKVLRHSPQWNLLTESEKHEIEDAIPKIKPRTETRKKQRHTQLDGSKWEVIEKIEDIDPPVFKLIKTMGSDIVLERHNNKQEWNGNDIIKWNPIREIKRYRQSVDYFRHFDLESILDFYATKVVVKYPSFLINEVLSPEKYSRLKKGFEIFERYREPFSKKNWRYTWVERLWIAIYAKTEGIGRTLNMLRALDGEKEGRVSRKYIKDLPQPTLKFWEEYVEYGCYLFEFLEKGLSLIKKDRVNNRIQKDIRIARKRAGKIQNRNGK